jgi:hypothetical protein
MEQVRRSKDSLRFREQLTASLTNTEEAAPFHLGSLSGKSCPMSGRLSAPRMASTIQCISTSPAQHQLSHPYGTEELLHASVSDVCRERGGGHGAPLTQMKLQCPRVPQHHFRQARLLPSEWASQPRSCGMVTPPMMRGRSGSRRCRSKPWPTRKGSTGALLAAQICIRTAAGLLNQAGSVQGSGQSAVWLLREEAGCPSRPASRRQHPAHIKHPTRDAGAEAQTQP